MIRVPRDFKPLLKDLTSSFARPATARRLIYFFASALIVTGDRTVSSILRLVALLEPVNPSTFHRLFSHRRWSSNTLARIIIAFILDRFVPTGCIRLAGDETVDGHRGKKVYGKARHRDAVRSSHSRTVYRYGHKWVVLAILIELRGTARPFALPILVALYRDAATNAAQGRRHKTPAELMCGLLAQLIRWFPERKFIFAGDNTYGTHAMSRFTNKHRNALTLVSKIVKDANLFALPPKRSKGKNGRPPAKGKALPKPIEVVESGKRPKRLKVRWYGGGWRKVDVYTGTGHWYKSGKGLVAIRWVYVIDRQGTHRDECFFATDPSLEPTEIIEMYGARWNIETTFQEMRAHLGLESTRGWTKKTVLRMAPCLFLLYSVVVLFYDTMPASTKHRKAIRWVGKKNTTFTDMMISVRHHLWAEWVFEHVPGGQLVQKLTPHVRKVLDFGLANAA